MSEIWLGLLGVCVLVVAPGGAQVLPEPELLVDSTPGPQSGRFSGPILPIGDFAFFGLESGGIIDVWASDGTPAGTHPLGLPPIYRKWRTVVPGGESRAYFLASKLTGGQDFWATDGTPEGTHLIFDGQIQLASVQVLHGFFSDSLGKTVFSHDDGVHGREMWFRKVHRSPRSCSLTAIQAP